MDESKKPSLKMLAQTLERRVRVEVGEMIRAARLEEDMSQAELAEMLDRRQAYISDIENGKTEPNATLLAQLAIVLQKPVQYFFPSDWLSDHQALKVEELSPRESELIHKLRELEQGFSYHLALRLLNTLADVRKEDEDFFNRMTS